MARREREYRVQRDRFVIVTNGRTEHNYFTLLKSYNSIYDVQVKFENADPLRLVGRAASYLDESNQVWIVFDIDNTYNDGKLILAISQAEKQGIKYAFSNLAFEVWVISHFQKCEKNLKTKDHEEILNKYLEGKRAKFKYTKTDENLLKKYFLPFYRNAVQNAKVVHQKRMAEHFANNGGNSQPCIWEWNSCTTVYKVVEALKLSK